MIVTLTGSNNFARQAELRKMVGDFIAQHTDMAIERFDGDEDDTARMRGSLASLPFLTERKLVLLTEPGKQKAFMEGIATILDEAADSSDVVIIEPKLDKRLSYYKTLKKSTDFREFAELDANGLAAWAVDYAKEQGGSLGTADARTLLDRVGLSQQLIKQELDKLLTYSPDITKASIELLTERAPQSTVFELLDAAFSGQTKRAMQLYREQRALKVEPQAIIAMLAWQLHVLSVVKAAGNRSAETIAAGAKLNPFVVRKSQGLARSLSAQQLKRQIADLLSLDVRLKTVMIDPDEALQLYLLSLAS